MTHSLTHTTHNHAFRRASTPQTQHDTCRTTHIKTRSLHAHFHALLMYTRLHASTITAYHGSACNIQIFVVRLLSIKFTVANQQHAQFASENHKPQCIVSSDASQTSSCKNQVERKIKTLDVLGVHALPEVHPHIKHGDHVTLPLATCTRPRSRQDLNTTKMHDGLYPCKVQPIEAYSYKP